jgi:DNA adenine methylase
VADWNNTDALWAVIERLKAVQIECDDAVRVIERYGRNPKTLIYCDPPYVRSTRNSGSNYEHEMSDEQHIELAQAIHSVEAMVLVSGYDCPLYRELYSDWAVATKKTLTNGGGAAIECLWISPRCQNVRLPLFATREKLR